MSNAAVELVLGGARSGKSRYAERRLAGAHAKVYIATAEAHDDEMAARIAAHRARRDGAWRTLEAPLDLAETITAQLGGAVLVDCLTLWLSNILLAERDVAAETVRLGDIVSQATGRLVLVSNEVGLGLVPETPLGRAFRDWQGRLNQIIAERAGRVVFVAAGLPLVLKETT